MQYRHKIIKREQMYQGFFRIARYEVDFELFRGGFSGAVMRECTSGAGFVVVALPYDPIRREFVFVEQFRIGAMVAGINPWQIEVVAGFMDKEGETPQQCAQRELQEEIGTRAQHLEHVKTYFSSPGGSAGRIHLFFAKICSENISTYNGVQEENEDIRAYRISYEEAFSRLRNGTLNNATMILAIQSFMLHKLTADEIANWQKN